MLQRVLFLWNTRHPACGYVQGMNEILVPLIVVFLSEICCINTESYLEPPGFHALSDEQLFSVEADSYWCLQRILYKI